MMVILDYPRVNFAT